MENLPSDEMNSEESIKNNIIDNTNCKNIIISPVIKTCKIIRESNKNIKPRIITTSKKWNIQTQYYDPLLQWNCLFNLNYDDSNILEENVRNQAKKQIILKISGYRSQDVKNNFFDITKFVNLEYVMELLEKSQMKCYYCKEITKVLYEHVREPRQWTLDRIENNQGHNISNVMIACLQCNLRRRCMYHERYVFTKQLKIVRSDLS